VCVCVFVCVCWESVRILNTAGTNYITHVSTAPIIGRNCILLIYILICFSMHDEHRIKVRPQSDFHWKHVWKPSQWQYRITGSVKTCHPSLLYSSQLHRRRPWGRLADNSFCNTMCSSWPVTIVRNKVLYI